MIWQVCAFTDGADYKSGFWCFFIGHRPSPFPCKWAHCHCVRCGKAVHTYTPSEEEKRWAGFTTIRNTAEETK